MAGLLILLILGGAVAATARLRHLRRGNDGGYWALRFTALAVVAFLLGAIYPGITVAVWLGQLVWLAVTMRKELKLRNTHLREIGQPRA